MILCINERRASGACVADPFVRAKGAISGSIHSPYPDGAQAAGCIYRAPIVRRSLLLVNLKLGETPSWGRSRCSPVAKVPTFARYFCSTFAALQNQEFCDITGQIHAFLNMNPVRKILAFLLHSCCTNNSSPISPEGDKRCSTVSATFKSSS
jgi:hypothetical protein